MKKINLKDALLDREDVMRHLTARELDAAMDPANYVGGSREITDKMVAAAEEVLDRKV